MKRQAIRTAEAPEAIGPYSQAVTFEAGRLTFLSGQIPLDPKTGEMVGGDDVQAQTRQVMENVRAVLAAGGLGFENVVKATIFLTDMGDFAAVNAVYAEYFDDDPPARAAVGVAALPKGAAVEIECIAAS
jgi:2-iminobutanoate/2-iminopropanoate deaminase